MIKFTRVNSPNSEKLRTGHKRLIMARPIPIRITAEELFRNKSSVLTDAISSDDPSRVSTELNAKGLIPQHIKDNLLTGRQPAYEKASQLVFTIEKQLECREVPSVKAQYLMDVCNVLKLQKNSGLENIAHEILGVLEVENAELIEKPSTFYSDDYFLSSVDDENLPSSLKSLEKKFKELMVDVEEAFKKKDNGLELFKRELQMCSCLAIQKINWFDAICVSDVFYKLRPYYDFMDCQIIGEIAESLEVENHLIERFKKHKHDADIVLSMATVKDLFKVLDSRYRQYMPVDTNIPKLNIKLQKDWEKAYVDRLKVLIKILLPTNAGKVDHKQSIMDYINISYGCIHIEYKVLHFTAESLITHAEGKKYFLHLIGVFNLHINDHCVFCENENENFTFQSAFIKASQVNDTEAMDFLYPLKDISRSIITDTFNVSMIDSNQLQQNVDDLQTMSNEPLKSYEPQLHDPKKSDDSQDQQKEGYINDSSLKHYDYTTSIARRIPLTVKISNTNFPVFVRPSDTIEDLKYFIKDKIIQNDLINDDDISHYQLIYDGRKLDDNELAVANYGITEDATLYLVPLNLLSITIKTVAGKSIALEVDACDTIENIKQMIQEREGIPTDQQRLRLGDKPLVNNRILSYYNIQNGYMINLLLRPRGSMTINIETLTNRKFKLEVELTDTIEDVKFKICDHEEILPKKQNLFLGTKLLEDSYTMLDYGIEKDSILKLVIHEPKSITIYIETLSTGKHIRLMVKLSDTIRIIKDMIQSMERIPPNQQRLTFADIHLRDDDTLSYYKVEDNSILQLFFENEFKWNVDNFAKEQIFDSSHYGIKVIVPPSAVREGEESINLTIKPINDEREWQLPSSEFTPVSYFYKVDSSRKFDKPIDVHLEQNLINNDGDLVSVIRKENSEYIDSSHHPKIIDNAAVVNLSDTQNQVIAIATKNAHFKRFAIMLLYKRIPTSNLMWNVKLIVTQDLGPYIERVKSDESLKDWHRQGFCTFIADLDSQLVLKSHTIGRYKVTSKMQPCQVKMSDVDCSRVDSVKLPHLLLRVAKIRSWRFDNKSENLNLEFQLTTEQAIDCTFTLTIFADDLDPEIVTPIANRKQIATVESSFALNEDMILSKRRPTNMELMQVLNQIKSKWKQIGIALEVSSDDIDSIYQKRQSPACYLNDVLIIWLDNGTSVTWLTAIHAINKEPVNEPKVAMEMKEFAIRIVQDSTKKNKVLLPTSVSSQSHLRRSMSLPIRQLRLSQRQFLYTPPISASVMKNVLAKIHFEIPKLSDSADVFPPMHLLLFQKESEK